MGRFMKVTQLVETAKESADVVAVSIFINPLSSHPMRTLSYPRDTERTLACAGDGVDLFSTAEEMYR